MDTYPQPPVDWLATIHMAGLWNLVTLVDRDIFLADLAPGVAPAPNPDRLDGCAFSRLPGFHAPIYFGHLQPALDLRLAL